MMKIVKNLLMWMPWIIFAFICKVSVPIALGVGIGISLLPYSKLRKGFMIEWGTLLYFIISFVILVLFQNPGFSKYLSLFAAIMLTTVTGISLLINRPFTAQYAKLETQKKHWNTFLFLRINTIMTATFGLYFLLMLLMNIFQLIHPEAFNFTLLFWPLLALKALYIHRFPKWYMNRHFQKKAIE